MAQQQQGYGYGPMPPYPPPAPKKSHGCLYAILGAAGVIVVIIIVLAVALSGGSKTGTSVSSNGTHPAAPAGKAAPSKAAGPAGFYYSAWGSAPGGDIQPQLMYGTNDNNVNAQSADLPFSGHLAYDAHQDWASINYTLSDSGGDVYCQVKVITPDGHTYARTGHASGPDSMCTAQENNSGGGWSGA